MGEIIYGVDFRAGRRILPYEEALEQMAARIWDDIVIPSLQDTAPSEYCAPENDPA